MRQIAILVVVCGALGCGDRRVPEREPDKKNEALQQEVGADRPARENDTARGATPGAFGEQRPDVGGG